MITLENQSGSVELFTADGGPGQEKWYCLRIHLEVVDPASGGDIADALVMINGTVTAYRMPMRTGQATFKTEHLLLTTDDVVSIDLGAYVSVTANLKVSCNVDAEEL